MVIPLPKSYNDSWRHFPRNPKGRAWFFLTGGFFLPFF